MLYPYRPSSIRTVSAGASAGCVRPTTSPPAAAANPACCMLNACCAATSTPKSTFAPVSCHLVERQVCALDEPLDHGPDQPPTGLRNVEAIEIDGRRWSTWQEAVERRAWPADTAFRRSPPALRSPTSCCRPRGDRAVSRRSRPRGRRAAADAAPRTGAHHGELPRSAGRCYASARGRRTRREADAAVTRYASDVKTRSSRPCGAASARWCLRLADRSAAELRAAADGLPQRRRLAGAGRRRRSHDAMLASPIILYDHPQIAPRARANCSTGPRSTRS